MKVKNIGSVLLVGMVSSIVTLSFVSAMDMNSQTDMQIKIDTIKKDTMVSDSMKKTDSMMIDSMKNSETMMDTSMKKNTMIANDMMMLEKVTPMSRREDISKLQMMLVEKGHLVMPEGVAYGYYGRLTKAAYTKYKKMSMMMKDDVTMKKDTMVSDSMKKGDTMMAH